MGIPRTVGADPERDYFDACGPREPSPVIPSLNGAKLQRLENAIHRAAGLFSADDPCIAPCPLAQRHALVATLVDSHGIPVENLVVELLRGQDHALMAKSDASGQVRFTGLEQGSYMLCLPTLDARAWRLSGSSPLPDEQDHCRNDAAWKAYAAVAIGEPFYHSVSEGECISTLGWRYGLLPDTIWNHVENAVLKASRKHKNVLLPKDRVFIPACERARHSVTAGRAYRIACLAGAEQLRIRFLDREGQPRANQAYLLGIVWNTGVEDILGNTDADGFIVAPVPATTSGIRIVMGNGAARESFRFGVASLDPISTLSGVQGRLSNLGYPCSEDAGQLGGLTRLALRDFQRDEGIPVAGELDKRTRDAIEARYLC